MRRTDSWEKTLTRGRLKAGGEVDGRGWDSWMALPTWYTWVWVGSGSWWCTGKPGVLQSMGSQRAGHDWVTELNWTHQYPGRLLPHSSSEVSWDRLIQVAKVSGTWACSGFLLWFGNQEWERRVRVVLGKSTPLRNEWWGKAFYPTHLWFCQWFVFLLWLSSCILILLMLLI